jgi:hypothetical protein
MAISAHSGGLDQFEEGNAAGGNAGEMEAIPYPAVSPSVTSQGEAVVSVVGSIRYVVRADLRPLPPKARTGRGPCVSGPGYRHLSSPC